MSSEIRTGRGPHFAQVPLDLLEHPEATAYHVSTYAALRSFADFGSAHGAHPSDASVARRAGCSERKLRACRNDLRAWGWVEWESGADAGITNIYVIHASLEPEGGSAPGAGGGRHDVPGGSAPYADDQESDTESDPTSPPKTSSSPETSGEGSQLALVPHENGNGNGRRDAKDRPPWSGGVVFAAWCEKYPATAKALSPAERGKLGAACKRLADAHSRDEVGAAWRGIERLAPFSMGQPWDPMDLERRFPAALAAAEAVVQEESRRMSPEDFARYHAQRKKQRRDG